jgi:glycosyltransferase involved in cell wall biosynthesis
MASGVTVVTSKAASMPEVAGEAAILVNPHDAQAITEGMQQVLYEDGLRDILIQKGLARTRHFTWESVAQKILELYAASM